MYLTVLGLVIILCLLSFFSYQAANAKLENLLDERAKIEQRHQQLLGYYVDMRRKSGYFDLIKKYSNEHNIHLSFISAIISRESHYDTNAQSGVGARGLMQVMEDTGSWISGKLKTDNYSYDRLYEPELNISFGAWYLANLSSQFNGNPVMIAAAYHAGPRNVKLWALKYADDKKTLTIDQIPKDNTRDYVKKVMEAYALYYEYDH